MSKPKSSKAALRREPEEITFGRAAEFIHALFRVTKTAKIKAVLRDEDGVHRAYDKDGKLCAVFGDRFAEAVSQMPGRKVKHRKVSV